MASQLTLPEVERYIFEVQRHLESSPRPHPQRPTLLRELGIRLSHRIRLLHEKGDYDKSITCLTEAVLLPPHTSADVVESFFSLGLRLLSRFIADRQPEDILSVVKYFRFLRINFDLLDTSYIPHGQLTSRFFQALVLSLAYPWVDTIPDPEEMMALFPEVLTLDVLTIDASEAMKTFASFVTITDMFHQKDRLQLAERLIPMLKEAIVLKPDSYQVSHALASCLAARFRSTHAINDFEDAIAIADKIVAKEIMVVDLIQTLLVSRLNSYPRPEYLEDAIRRVRALLSLPSVYLSDQHRLNLAGALHAYLQVRPSYFDITGTSGETHPTPQHQIGTLYTYRSLDPPGLLNFDPEDDPTFLTLERLRGIIATVENDETSESDVAAAVELSRKLLQRQSSHHWWFAIADAFAAILFLAQERTDSLEYLNEAITAYRDIRKMPAPKTHHFRAGENLFWALLLRYSSLHLRQDFEELMQITPELANNESGEVIRRFTLSYRWANLARTHVHPSTSTAYSTALSHLQTTLVFFPTLQAQHFNLAHLFKEGGGLPSDYASYQIELGQPKQAIETLERGRALLWSEMRGLRVSTDQLREANPALADKLAEISRRLESVTMSVSPSEDILDDSGTETWPREGMDSVGHLVTTQRRLSEERETLISHIQSLSGFENFLKPASFDVLNSAAENGPVIMICQSRYPFPSYIILLLRDSPPSVVSTSNFHDRAHPLKDKLLRVRKENGLDSEEYNLALTSVLAGLYELVGKPVIRRLCHLKVPEKSRVWWCPTGAFCSLPLHAMGPIPSEYGKELYFSDLYTSSYTPTLSALIESRKPGSLTETSDDLKPKPSLLLVAQPDTLPGAWGEIGVIQSTTTPVTTLISATVMPKTVIERLKDHQFAHFICHGLLETGKPFDASFELNGDNLTLLDIVRSQLPAAEFAFLSACHTAELTEDSVDDEGLHLAAAMQFCGFRSVVGTMWAMADTDGAELSKHFYKAVFSDKAGQDGVPYHERSARALQIAVEKLRKKRGMTLERWVNFVHYGA